MISQCWINHRDISLAAVSYQPVKPECAHAVVLISGFSQPMCDTNYFMSRMARRLAGNGLYVLQVDPLGHGDSPGDLAKVTLDSLREDIHSSVQYASQQSGGRVFCVGRGLIATLMAELAPQLPVDGVAGINPYCLETATVKKLMGNISAMVIDTADLIGGNDFKSFLDCDYDMIALFEALGAGSLFDLLGQRISKQIIQELMVYEPFPILQAFPDANLWLVPDKNAGEGMSRWIPLDSVVL